ncbi:MAG: hypothetical protein M5R36_14775 [Deltaproteobacteria bacterium]|nr:hypothetical protein [Deltaproteobacteria bacterium]
MGRRILWLLALSVAGGAVIVAGMMSGNPFPDGRAGGPAWQELIDGLLADDARAERASPSDLKTLACLDSCDRVVECGLLPDVSYCLPWCLDEWDAKDRACVAATECDLIEEYCFDRTPESLCAEVCEELSECGEIDFGGSSCVDICLDRWSHEERECLLEAECGFAVEQCLDNEERVPCALVCDKLAGCGTLMEGEFGLCLDMCEQEMDSAMRDCVVSNECGEIDAVCVEGLLPEDLCADACAAAVDCGLVGAGASDCVFICEEEWSDELAICLADAESCEESGQCFDEPDVVCNELCVFLIGCGLLEEEEFEFCASGCPTEFSDAERDCMMTADCAGATGCLDGASETPVNHCPEACFRLARCGLIDVGAQLDCTQTCMETWGAERVECVMGASCESAAVDCLSETP